MNNQKNRKFLVVVDDTTECHRAISYASQCAVRRNWKLTMLRVINPTDFKHLFGVEKIMRKDASDQAKEILKTLADGVSLETGLKSELIIRFGETGMEIIKQIKEDPSICLLVLAAAIESGNPGPLISQFTGSKAGDFPIPITIIPGNLSEKNILSLT